MTGPGIKPGTLTLLVRCSNQQPLADLHVSRPLSTVRTALSTTTVTFCFVQSYWFLRAKHTHHTCGHQSETWQYFCSYYPLSDGDQFSDQLQHLKSKAGSIHFTEYYYYESNMYYLIWYLKGCCKMWYNKMKEYFQYIYNHIYANNICIYLKHSNLKYLWRIAWVTMFSL